MGGSILCYCALQQFQVKFHWFKSTWFLFIMLFLCFSHSNIYLELFIASQAFKYDYLRKKTPKHNNMKKT